MHFAQIYTPGIAQCSYVVGSGKKCVVVDPIRSDINVYLEKAKEFGMEIAGILETHLHADFISGHMELADLTGAKIYAPEVANCTSRTMPWPTKRNSPLKACVSNCWKLPAILPTALFM